MPFAGSIPANRNASRARAHHDPGSFSECRGQRNLDVGGDDDTAGDILPSERLAKLIPLGLAAGPRGAHYQDIAQQQSGTCEGLSHHIGYGAG
jgi:hypothetical protein